MTRTRQFSPSGWLPAAVFVASLALPSAWAGSINLSQEPLFLTQSQSPLVMLTMARDHKLYYEAYNDYSDLDGDGTLDLVYKPGKIDYYGYFDSYKCYNYDSSNNLFVPATATNSPQFIKSDGSEMSASEKVVERLTRKRCTGQWSGDWLNYVTTSRMDALRKVLYGGYRSTDTSSKTVLERVFVPQDAHAWGKEYKSIARDGYDIRNFTPLSLPTSGNYHLFASVTLLASGDSTGNDTVSARNSPPLLRVLNNTKFRVWEWLSIERPVAGSECATGNNSRSACVSSVGTTWTVVSNSNVLGGGTTLYSYSHNRDHPNNRSEMDDFFTRTTGNRITATRNTGTTITSIDCKDNNCDLDPAADDNYAVAIVGNIVITNPGTYSFAIDGDDAIDFTLGTGVSYNTMTRALTLPPPVPDPNNPPNTMPDPSLLTLGWYGGHGFSGDQTHNATKYLAAGTYPFVLRMQEGNGGDGYRLKYQEAGAASAMTDYTVRVQVCDATIGLESNCRAYGSSPVVYKPTGLLQQYGENNAMYFGMISGSYRNNTRGGVLRKNIASINNEIDSATGVLTSTVGIIRTIDRLRITDFRYGSHDYSCGWITTRPMQNGECNMWGNPIGEMVLEAIRYFAGKATPTASFVANVADSGTSDAKLDLPLATWVDPYRTSGGFPHCSKPYLMAISDVYPSFDADSIPGSKFCTDESTTSYPCSGTTFGSGDLSGFDLESIGQSVWNKEFGTSVSKSVFIGQSGASYDNAPTPKTATSFGTLRGLSPSEPTRQGSFSSAIAAYYGHMNDLSNAAGSQKASAYAIALAPPLPTIEVPMGDARITIVPFAKSVGGSSISNSASAFQPTNQIVDFYIDDIANTSAGDADSTVNGGRPYYKFRINYEDVEQGADHDMDAISTYEIKKLGDNLISVSISSDYAAGGIIQHMGYVISGAREVSVVLNSTTGDVQSVCEISSGASNSIYLDVRDSDTNGNTDDPAYGIDTRYNASVVSPSSCTVTSNAYPAGGPSLGLSRTRYFRVDSAASAASLLKDPLWYMAKFGGFHDDDTSPNGIPEGAEWDSDGDGVPDNYFLVVNPLKLEQQMGAALAKISKDAGTAAALATNSTSLRSTSVLYQARFSSDGWGGEVNAYPILPDGTLDQAAWRAQDVMYSTPIDPATRVMLTYDPAASSGNHGIPFRWTSMTSNGTLQQSLNTLASSGSQDGNGENRLLFLRGGVPTGFRQRPACGPPSTCVVNFLGDIVNSALQYVGAPSFGYGLTSYRDFYNARKNRTPLVYVGGNDGMLHGFDAATGQEKLAYVPSVLYRNAKLSKLTAPDYGKTSNKHAFYVDGSPTVGDVCDSGCADASSWKTLLVGGLGGGGQGIYALDITDPSTFSESNAASLVKWEFTDGSDAAAADLGYTYSRPSIVRLCTTRDSSGTSDPQPCTAWQWVVVFGNGYNSDEADGIASSSSYAHLFIVDALTGTLLKKLTTTVAATPNGLATATLGDIDSDGIADFAYAADLNGNMWKFDLTTISSANVAYRLYHAQTTSGASQAITTMPKLVRHPLGGVMVIFGTGKYLEATDKNTSQQQTLYGIWDKRNATAGVSFSSRNNLQQQQLISNSTTYGGAIYSTTTANGVDWDSKLGWYLDLLTDGSNPSERVAYDPQLLGSNLLNVPTIIPSNDICDYGGTSWDYMLSPLTGARLDYDVFTNVPRIVISTSSSIPASRRQSTVGISPTGTTVTIGRGAGVVYKGGSGGGGGGGSGSSTTEVYGITLQFGLGRRLSWRELETD